MVDRVLRVEDTSRQEIANGLTTEWARSLALEPTEKAVPVEDVLEGIAVQTNYDAVWLEIVEAYRALNVEVDRGRIPMSGLARPCLE